MSLGTGSGDWRAGPTAKGSSSAGGITGFSNWQCNAAQAGQVWTFTMTRSSGHSINDDLVLTGETQLSTGGR